MNKRNIFKILITGGAGFIGSHLTDALLNHGYEVMVLDNLRNGSLDNLESAFKNKNFKFIKGDILDKDVCDKATSGINAVFHLACLGVRHSIHSPFENHKVNAEGTLNILEASLKNEVKKFFYISTSEIYGGVKSFPIKETDLPLPFTVYGSSKLAGELYTNSYNKCFGLDTTVLRIFNNYGSRAHYEGDAGEIIPRSIVNILYNKQPIIFGDGSNTRDFFYVKDTANALSLLLDIDKLNGRTINIGTGIEYTMKFVIDKILSVMNKTDLGINFLESRPADVPRLWVDASDFYELTDYKPEYSFDDGLKETIEYYDNLSKDNNLLERIIIKNWGKK